MENKKEVKFLYEKSDTYFETFADGIYGSISPYGMLNMFLVESKIDMPDSEILLLNESGTTQSNTINMPDNLKKIVKGCVTMPSDTIPSFIDWLQGRYDEFQKIKAGVVNDK